MLRNNKKTISTLFDANMENVRRGKGIVLKRRVNCEEFREQL